MSSATFNSHFNMIGLHQPVHLKARFWQSYVRALKGTEDIRADENSLKRGRAKSQQPEGRPFSATENDLFPKFFDDLATPYGYTTQGASSRIKAPGYRYLPVSRETYGSGPRELGSAYPLPPSPRPRSTLSRSRY